MPKNIVKHLVTAVSTILIVFSLILTPSVVGNVGAAGIFSTPAEVGYIDYVYGTGVKAEPTADVPESKLWFNDGYWWGILFDPAADRYLIHWLDWGTQTWQPTTVEMDSRVDAEETGDVVGTRFDTLWDEDDEKLYVASHIKISNPSRFNSSENHGRMYRYSYDAVNKTYTLDSGFPVTVNIDRTEALVMDKDSTGRLWVTYVSRNPSSDPVGTYQVYVNYTTGNDASWSDIPIRLNTIDATAATVALHDVSSVIAYGDKVGVMWSNAVTNTFYFAEHSASSSPTSGWNIVAVNPTNLPVGVTSLVANDHIKLVTNAAGQVFATVKTHNTVASDPLLGVIARDTNGTFTFHQFSDVSSNDTRPSLVYNDTENRLYMFASSNPTGGVVCYKTMDVVSPLSNMAFAPGNCSDAPAGSAPHFIRSSQYHKIDNPTTSKRNVNASTGLVVMATDDKNGGVYLHNKLGNPLAVITNTVPGRGGVLTGSTLVVKLTFSHPLDPSTVNTSNITVEDVNNGPVDGEVTYDAATRTVTFTATEPPVDSTYQVSLSTNLRDANNRALHDSGQVLEFQMNVETVEKIQVFLPIITN